MSILITIDKKKGTASSIYAEYNMLALSALVKEWFLCSDTFKVEASKKIRAFFNQNKPYISKIGGNLASASTSYDVIVLSVEPSLMNIIRSLPRVFNGEVLLKIPNQIAANSFIPSHKYGKKEEAELLGYHTRLILLLGLAYGIIKLKEDMIIKDGISITSSAILSIESFPDSDREKHGQILTSQDSKINVLDITTHNAIMSHEIEDIELKKAVTSRMGMSQKAREVYALRRDVRNDTAIYNDFPEMAEILLTLYKNTPAYKKESPTKRQEGVYPLWLSVEESMDMVKNSVKDGAFVGLIRMASTLVLRGDDLSEVTRVLNDFVRSEVEDLKSNSKMIKSLSYMEDAVGIDTLGKGYTPPLTSEFAFESLSMHPTESIALCVGKAFRNYYNVIKENLI